VVCLSDAYLSKNSFIFFLIFTHILSLILPIIYFLILAFIIARSSFFVLQGYSRLTALLIFTFKVISGFIMWAIYTFYYTDTSTGDMHNYFSDAQILFNTFKDSPGKLLLATTGINDFESSYGSAYLSMKFWYRQYNDSFFNETHLMIRFNAFLMIFSSQNFHVHTIFMAFISFIGLMFIYKSLLPIFSGKVLWLMPCVMLTPSLMFWSSGMIKEPLVVLGLGLILYPAFIARQSLPKRLICAALGLFILLFTKFYVLFCIVPPLVAYLIPAPGKSPKAIIIKHAAIAVFTLTFAFCAPLMSPTLNFSGMLVNKQNAFLNVAELWNAGSFTNIPRLTGTFTDILIKAPLGFYNTLFKPLPMEVNNPLLLAAFLENILIFVIIFYCIWNATKAAILQNINFILFAGFYVILLFCIIGLTTPVIGALVRYKIVGIPFLLLLFLAMVSDKSMPPFKLKHITQ
jgi:hypothetical protein